MKKLISIFLISMLVLSLCACDLIPGSGRETEKPTEPESFTEEPATELTTEEPTTVPTEPEPVLSVEEQIALFVSNRDMWYPKEDYYVPYSYAVTDLDQNGRLEILVNVCMGTGFFSQNSAWEVNEAGDGISSCGEIFEDQTSQIDLGATTVPVYLDAEGTLYYIVSDYIREGWAYNVTLDFSMQLQEGQLVIRPLASAACEAYEDGTQIFTYRSGSGDEISQEEYEQMADTVFAEAKAMVATFGWQSKVLEETDLLDADGWHRLLEQSWADFSVQ